MCGGTKYIDIKIKILMILPRFVAIISIFVKVFICSLKIYFKNSIFKDVCPVVVEEGWTRQCRAVQVPWDLPAPSPHSLSPNVSPN